MKKKHISCSQAGMGDRLVCFASTLIKDENAKIYWPVLKSVLGVGNEDINKKPTHGGERPFDQLFDYEGHIEEYNGIPIEDNMEEIMKKFDVSFNGSWRLWLGPLESKYGHQDYKYTEVIDEVRHMYRPIFDRIKSMVRSDIIEEVNEYTNKMDDNIVGVHLRTFDGKHYFNKDFDNDYQGVINLFRNAMNKFPKDTKFLFATDDERAKQILKEDFDIIELDNRRIWDQRFDLIEALVLAKCKNLILTSMSHYSELIWWFAGSHDNVIPLYPNVQLMKTGSIPNWLDESLFKNEIL